MGRRQERQRQAEKALHTHTCGSTVSRGARDLSQDAIMANRHSAYSSLQSEDEEASYYSAPSRVVHRMPSDMTDYGDGYLAPRPLSGVSGTSGSSVSSRSLPEPPQVRSYVCLNMTRPHFAYRYPLYNTRRQTTPRRVYPRLILGIRLTLTTFTAQQLLRLLTIHFTTPYHDRCPQSTKHLANPLLHPRNLANTTKPSDLYLFHNLISLRHPFKHHPAPLYINAGCLPLPNK